jgi:ATP-dependent helicase/DNAse subunit B
MSELGPVTLADVLPVLRRHLGPLRPEKAEQRYGKVFAASIEDARGMSFRLVFVPGLSEGRFPAAIRQDPLLLDAVRAEIGMRQATGEEERELFHVCAAAATHELILSFPRVDLATGRERVPSLYIYDSMRSARGESLDVRRLQEEARSGITSTLGWPAPAVAEDAIDDAEFDLAALREPFERNLKGEAAYLTQVNRYVANQLRSRWRRWSPRWRAADGMVEPDVETLGVLDKHRLRRKAYSASALEQFAACPYRFFLRSICALRPSDRAEPLERMDPTMRGTLYHSIQFELLRALAAEGTLPVTDANLTAAQEKLDRTLASVAEQAAEEWAIAFEHVWRNELESIRMDLRCWLAELTRGDDWFPWAFELSFGRKLDGHHDERSVLHPVSILDGILLRGSIDLVERHTGGMMRVTDHKTGSAPEQVRQIVGKGEVLQPLLYALGAEAMLGSPVVAGRLSYATVRGNYRDIIIPLNSHTRDQMALVLDAIDGWIGQGFLPPAPRERACKRCDYLPVCGPWEEERWTRKSHPELKVLADIRGME